MPEADNRLDPVELDVVTQASLKPNQTEAIVERLAAMEKTLAAGDKTPDPAYVKSKLGERLEQPFPTSGLVEAFARRLVFDGVVLFAFTSLSVEQRHPVPPVPCS